MLHRKTIVRTGPALTKAQVHDYLMIGWQRMIAKFGIGAVADQLEISTVAINKQLTGSMPDFATIIAARSIDDQVLDDIADALGVRIVAKDAVCDTDDLNLLLAKIMVKVNEATHPDGPGGRTIVHTEYLETEPLMREMYAAAGAWLEKCSQIRRPRGVAA